MAWARCGSATGHRIGGELVAVNAMLGDEPWHTVSISRVSQERRRRVVLHGDEGVAWLSGDGWSTSIFVAHDEGTEPTELPVDGPLPLLAQLQAFVDHLVGGPPPKSSGEEAVAEARCIAAIRAAA